VKTNNVGLFLNTVQISVLLAAGIASEVQWFRVFLCHGGCVQLVLGVPEPAYGYDLLLILYVVDNMCSWYCVVCFLLG
jgi:hypothetical protein